MTYKKSILILLIAIFSQLSSSAQTDWGWSWTDSAVVANKLMPQRAEFLANEYPYPPKPRSMWEVGISLGNSRIFGDVTNFKIGYGFGINARKALSNVISVRGGLIYAQTAGLDPILSSNAPTDGFLTSTTPYRAITGYDRYAAYTPANVNRARRAFAANYVNKSYTGTLDVVISTNTVSHYRGNPKWDIYLFAGYAFVAANVTTRLSIDSAGNVPFDFSTLNYNGKKAEVQSDVNAALNAANAVATVAPKRDRRRDLGSGDMIMTHAFSFGAGFSYKLNEKMSVGFENRFINTLNGDMDAMHTGRNDYMNFASAHFRISLGNRSKKVQPLYWLNPNNYVYRELNEPRHMKMSKPTLNDADKDGVTDQFDLEPNTPLGAPVDSHGVSKDTDGDGVPDYKDKELLTLQQCFPVNADGVGNCPEPACCKELKILMTNKTPEPVVKTECTLGNLLSLPFRGNARLTREAQQLLAEAAVTIKANPACKIKVIGYGSASKSSQQLSWERVNAVVKFLVEKQGISESRLLFVYAQDGDAAMVDLQGTTEDGPNTVPAPHPNLKSKD
ncbi:MAG: OmpA family protein [Sediminibacterium sp.]